MIVLTNARDSAHFLAAEGGRNFPAEGRENLKPNPNASRWVLFFLFVNKLHTPDAPAVCIVRRSLHDRAGKPETTKPQRIRRQPNRGPSGLRSRPSACPARFTCESRQANTVK
jgi:hypothetical protein